MSIEESLVIDEVKDFKNTSYSPYKEAIYLSYHVKDWNLAKKTIFVFFNQSKKTACLM